MVLITNELNCIYRVWRGKNPEWGKSPLSTFEKLAIERTVEHVRDCVTVTVLKLNGVISCAVITETGE